MPSAMIYILFLLIFKDNFTKELFIFYAPKKKKTWSDRIWWTCL